MYKVISATSPVWLIKSSQLNYEMNTGHINMIKSATESPIWLLDEPKNIKNGAELINIQSD